jgi:hypothetical protein
MEDVFHHRAVWLALGGGPGGPTDEAVDCIAVLRLVQRELVAPAVELVAAVLKPVRPRDQYLTSARGAHLVGPVSVDKLPAADRVRAESTTNLDDHSLLISDCDLDLFAGWRDHRSPPIRPAVSRTLFPEGTRGRARVITSYAPWSEMRELGDDHAGRSLD